MGANLRPLVCLVEGCIIMLRTDDGTQHRTWQERTAAHNIPAGFNDALAGGRYHWVPEPAALGKERPANAAWRGHWPK